MARKVLAASLAVMMMARFPGLPLAQGAGQLAVPRRKAAVALGGGVWSVHFVAMPGLNLPIPLSYGPLVTPVSALASILVTGVAFLIRHFMRCRARTITAAWGPFSVGSPILRCIGMSGMALCRPVCTLGGVALALVASIALSMTAVWVACSDRGRRNFAGPGPAGQEPVLRNQTLTMIVTLSAFVILAAFLLTGIAFAPVLAPLPAPAPPCQQ